MQSSTLKKVGKRVLQFGLPVVILVFFYFSYVKPNWHALMQYKFQLNLWFFVLAFAGFLLQELSYGLIWRSVLARLGSQLSLMASLRIYLSSEFVRYIPGNVWHVLTRILWVGKYGVSRPIAFASMTIELITKLAAGALIFAVSLLFWGAFGVRSLLSNTPLLVIAGIGIILVLLVGLHPHILGSLLNGALRVLKREPVVLAVRYLDILLVTLAWFMSWFVAGCAFYFLLLALWSQAPLVALPVCIGIYAIAWDIGFVTLITPGGLGFREGAITLLFALALPLPVGLAAIIAILSRLVSTLAELVCVSIAYLGGGGGRQIRAVQQEQASPPSTHVERADTSNTSSLLSSETSTRISVEGVVMHD